uniref:Uncharacterized protein C1orf87-like n=1 Tax=Phallusia mammillata TaxID=59560 RepID=A0A6F9D876_9ASCI|nr:uncharacterized protein C1orf87-like [Phallusia mammillata]
MNWVTQNAPFGTDNTPVLEVKIVGGKRVEILADKDESASGVNAEDKISPPRGPHGTPSMLTQPFFRSYEYSDLQHGFNTAKQHQLARQVTSYTSPNGDRSRSFRHGVPLLNKHPILPPIGASQPAGNAEAHPNEFSKNDVHRESLKDKPSDDDALESLISNQMHGFRHDKLKDMYIELTGFDRHLTGFVNEAQLNLVAMRYDLPIKMSTLKLLLHKFRDRHETRSVNYEKLLQFLSYCLSQSTKTNKTKMIHQQPNVSRVFPAKSPDQAKSPLKLTLHTQGSEANEKLLSLLRMQLNGSDEIDLRNLNAAFSMADRLANGELPSYVVERICVEQRLPLTSSVILKMLQTTETSHGNINWREFVDLLACADERLAADAKNSKTLASPAKTPTNPTKISASGVWSDGHPSTHNGILDDSPPVDSRFARKSLVRSPSADIASLASSKQSRHMSTGWDEREPRPIGREDQQNMIASEMRKTETWIRNFTRLAHALRNYHPYKSDALPRAEVARMANNYNLIYSLGFSKHQLKEAITRAVTSHSKDVSDQTVSVDKLLENLASLAHD